MSISPVTTQQTSQLVQPRQTAAPAVRDPDHDGDVDTRKPILGSGKGTIVDVDA